jgi:hypothetical protein
VGGIVVADGSFSSLTVIFNNCLLVNFAEIGILALAFQSFQKQALFVSQVYSSSKQRQSFVLKYALKNFSLKTKAWLNE